MMPLLRAVLQPAGEAFRLHRRSTIILLVVLALTGAAVIPVARLAAREGPSEHTAATLVPVPDADLAAPGSQRTSTPSHTQQQASDSLYQFALGCALSILALGLLTGLTLGGARTTTRLPEFAIRRAIGGSRRQLFASISVEGLLLASATLVAATLLAWGGWTWLQQSWPGSWSAASDALRLKAVVVLAGGSVAALVLPYLVAPRPRLSGEISQPLSLLLPIAQVACSLLILVSGGLMVRHAQRQAGMAQALSAPGQVVSLAGAEGRTARSAQYQHFLSLLDDSSAIRSASLGSHGLLLGLGTVEMALTDCGDCAVGMIRTRLKPLLVTEYLASPDTFDALGVKMIEGRGFTRDDRADAPRVAVVTRSLAQIGFQRGEAVGRDIRIRSGEPGANPDGEWFRVVGIVDDYTGNGYGVGQQAPLGVFLSVIQHPPRQAELLVRGGSDAREDVRRAAGDSQLTIERMISEEELMLAAQQPNRWFGNLFGLLGAMILLIGGIGSLVVMRAWLVTLIPELGLRRALGAGRWRLVGNVLGRLLFALGIAVAFALYVEPGIRLTLNRIVGGDVGSGGSLLMGGAVLLGLGALMGVASPLYRALSAPPAGLMEHSAE
jgi:hypothetical protein